MVSVCAIPTLRREMIKVGDLVGICDESRLACFESLGVGLVILQTSDETVRVRWIRAEWAGRLCDYLVYDLVKLYE